MTDSQAPYTLRVASSAERQLNRLPAKIAAAVVELLVGPLKENPHRLGGRLSRELAGLHSARRGVYQIIYEIDDVNYIVNVLRIEHRSTAYRQM